jgi:hypothetical protein
MVKVNFVPVVTTMVTENRGRGRRSTRSSVSPTSGGDHGPDAARPAGWRGPAGAAARRAGHPVLPLHRRAPAPERRAAAAARPGPRPAQHPALRGGARPGAPRPRAGSSTAPRSCCVGWRRPTTASHAGWSATPPRTSSAACAGSATRRTRASVASTYQLFSYRHF